MNEEFKTRLKDVRFLLKYIYLPQLGVSSFIVFSIPFFHHYIARPLLHETARSFTIVIYALLFILFLVRYVWLRLEVLNIKGSKRAAAFALPGLFTLLSTAIVFFHFDKQNERLYSIENISSIKKSDSTEFYQINNYHILYEEAKIKSVYHYSSGNRREPAVNYVHTYVVCPIILNYMTDYQVNTHELWIGFKFDRGVVKDNFTEDDFKNLETMNMYEFEAKQDITYFKETYEPIYSEIVKEQFSPDAEKIEVLESHFDPYEAYNGYGNILGAIYVQLGLFLFTFLVSLQYDIDQWEQKAILDKKNWKL